MPADPNPETREVLDNMLTRLDNLIAQVEDLNVIARKINRRLDHLFYLGLAMGAGIIAAILLQPFIAGGG